jgi:ankyrin repeat protein
MISRDTSRRTAKKAHIMWIVVSIFFLGMTFSVINSEYSSAEPSIASRRAATERLLSSFGYEKERLSVEEVTRLIQEGADVNAVDLEGKTVLMKVVQNTSLDPKLLQVVKVLIENGADVNAVDKWGGETSLSLAAKSSENSEILRILIESGANVNVADKQGKTPLMLVTEMGNSEAIRILIENGADVNAVDTQGKTPLMHAAERRNPEPLQILIESGADINTADRMGKKASDYTKKANWVARHILGSWTFVWTLGFLLVIPGVITALRFVQATARIESLCYKQGKPAPRGRGLLI